MHATPPEQASTAHTIYGLRLDSTRPIPGVPRAEANLPADVFVSLEGIPDRFAVPAQEITCPWYVSPYQSDQGDPSLALWRLEDGAFLRLRYFDGTEFVVDRSGATVWAEWPANSSLEDTFIYLLGPVLGFVLRLRGILCLHASVVARENQALAIIGPSGAGKSTTAAALAMRGCSVIADDVAAVVPDRKGFRVAPGYSRLRLWPASSSILFGSADHLPKLVPNWDKCYLDLEGPGFAFESRACPLAAIYFLEERVDSEQSPELREMLPREALIALIANTYVNYLLGPEQRAQEFEMLGKLISKVVLRKIVPHANPARLDAMCQLILSDFRDQRTLQTTL